MRQIIGPYRRLIPDRSEIIRLAALIVCAGVAACTPAVSLIYTPGRPVAKGPAASIAAVTATDARTDGPNVIASKAGAYGIIPTLTTRRPVAEEVAAVFTKAVRSRGMFAAAAPYRIGLTITRLHGHTMFGAHILDGPVTDDHTATIGVSMDVRDQAGRVVYRSTAEDVRDRDTLAADEDDQALTGLLQTVVSAAADHLLDDPAFRTAIGPH